MAHNDLDGKTAPWHTPPGLWEKLRPLAREKRHDPTPAEDALWQHVRRNQIAGFHFRRQHTIERFIVDFYCAAAQLVVEVDGPIHDYTPAEDAIRQAFLESRGLRVLRFTNDDVLTHIDEVLDTIRAALVPRSDSATPSLDIQT